MNDRHYRWTGLRIRQSRRARGMTQEQLALAVRDRLGPPHTCHQSSVSNWEHGRVEVSLRFRRPLADALGVPVDILFEAPPVGWQPSEVAA